jgi:preprotein translocase subunit SecA
LKTIYPIGLTIDEVIQEAGNKGRVNREFMRREIQSDALVSYKAREDALGTPAMRELERRVVLSVIDRRWRDHLYEMDYLKDGIGLRAMAQRDPLVEYQREGFALYQGMMAQIKSESVGFLFNLEVEVNQAPGDPAHPSIAAKGLARDDAAAGDLSYIAPSEDGNVEVKDESGRVEQAATSKAQNLANKGRQLTPEQAQKAAPAAGQVGRGAFGQKSPDAPPAANRADRRKK